MNIKEIIQRLRTAMDDARGEESHFQSWLIQNEGICDAIDALKELDNSQRTWSGLTDKDWNRSKHNYDFQKGVDWAESILKEKNA
jgi:hypothetical protein